ncbi:MAG: hypothetical protein APF80_06855 [Alphaproteobacteria bacterium BRH_c36]|nr:MAG: hypothetical protein APF80_06855 [Alphaproteobacteria bacterium BRH_c36]
MSPDFSHTRLMYKIPMSRGAIPMLSVARRSRHDEFGSLGFKAQTIRARLQAERHTFDTLIVL